MLLEGIAAVITGGGKGIGRGIVDRFLAEGARVAIIQRRPLTDSLAADERVVHIAADLSIAESAQTAIDTAAKRLGGLNALVNNAGIMLERSVDDLTVDEWDLMVALNLRAPVFLAQAALPHFRTHGGGSIINIGSIEGIAANPDHTVYAACKAGIHGITRALAVDLGSDNIRCNAIAPGWIASDLSTAYLDSHPDPAGARQTLDRLHPVGRLGAPTDIGNMAAFLVSSFAEFITGEVITVDGGRTARLPTPF